MKILPYEQRVKAKQVPVEYGLHIYYKEAIEHMKATKKSAGITTYKYRRLSSTKGYKNLEWLDKMFNRKMAETTEPEMHFKVIYPLTIPKNYKIYDHNGDYYATILGEDEQFYYMVVKKSNEAVPFLKDMVRQMYLKAQCDNTYGFTVPHEFVKDFERKG